MVIGQIWRNLGGAHSPGTKIDDDRTWLNTKVADGTGGWTESPGTHNKGHELFFYGAYLPTKRDTSGEITLKIYPTNGTDRPKSVFSEVFLTSKNHDITQLVPVQVMTKRFVFHGCSDNTAWRVEVIRKNLYKELYAPFPEIDLTIGYGWFQLFQKERLVGP